MIINGTEPLPDLYVVPPITLWIRRMHSNLTGSYTCRVIANHLKAESTSVVVMQGTKASDNCGVQFRKSPKDRELPQGETMVMQCAAQVSLQPTSVVTIAWLRNGLPFPTSSRYRDQSNGLAYVNDATPKDTAVYTCVATDRHSRCSIKRSALYRVLPRISVDEICGNPVVSRANTTRPPTQQGKIVGGEDTVKGAHPWQVMLWSPSLERAFCGGTLLNDLWVLSAAHCFQHELVQLEEVQVRLGKHDRLEAEPEEVTTKITDIYFHPKFNASTYDNDIALLLLADRVKFTDYIQPACLGDRAAIERNEFNSTDGVRKGKVTGWGQLAENGHTLPRYLQEIELPIVNQDVCRNATKYKVTDNMFCAGYAQEIVGDACQGDSGSPFVVWRKNRWYVVGIVSWGVGCGRKGNYGYYTKVTNYHDWIREKIMY
nr:prothrombin-like [Rhipicephalus microplus]